MRFYKCRRSDICTVYQRVPSTTRQYITHTLLLDYLVKLPTNKCSFHYLYCSNLEECKLCLYTVRCMFAVIAHKECTADGSWLTHPATGRAWSNYTLCVESDERAGGLVVLYETGYAISLAALLAALLVLGHFRALRCARTTLHAHLFAAFALNNALWLAWYGLVVRAPAVLAAGPAWCRALHAALQYALLATYTWMLCEGLYLHTVLVASFVSERRLLRALVPLGWLLPLPSVIAHVCMRARDRAPLCWLYEGAPTELAALAAVAVLLNAALLVNIVRVLCGKLRAGAGAAPPSQNSAALQALRATCLLAPLLGVQYLLLPVRPSRDGAGWMLYEIVAALCGSLQGACVAVLYCFCNGEVRAQLRRRWRAITFRPRANSTTNTTVSVSICPPP